MNVKLFSFIPEISYKDRKISRDFQMLSLQIEKSLKISKISLHSITDDPEKDRDFYLKKKLNAEE